MAAGGWDFLAGFANTLGGQLQGRQEAQEKEKLRKMQEDAAMKRDMFLAEYKSGLDQKEREADYERTKNDVTAQFTNPETGEVMGRTKSGKTIPLLETSEEYKNAVREEKLLGAQKKQLEIENAGMQPELTRARIAQANASAARSGRATAPKPKEDKLPTDIRRAYMEEAKRIRAAGGTDEAELDTTVRANLYPIFGGENVERSLGPLAGSKQEPAKMDNPASMPLAQASQSVTQPNAPTVEEILARANAAVKAGADPAKVEARMAQLMQQYGYAQ